jgi:uncharacterized RDD family membrane protein YckC
MAQYYETGRPDGVYAYDGVISRRMFAFLIDYAIILCLMVPAAVVLFFLSILTLGLGFYLFPVLFFVVAGLYFGLTLSSFHQATLGMRVMDVMLVRDNGQPIDFAVGVLHVVAFWILNSFLTPLVLLVVLFTERKRALHDLILGTSMVRSGSRVIENY